VDLSLPSFLSSLHSSSDLVSSILSASGISVESSFLHEALDQWSAEYPMSPEDHRYLQHGWDELLYEDHFSALLNSASDAKTNLAYYRLLHQSLVLSLVLFLYLLWVPSWMMRL